MTRDAGKVILRYSPSWINRLNQWVGRLPGKSWTYYFGFGLVLFLIQTAVSWMEGAVPVGNFIMIQIFLVAGISFMLGIIPYFDNRAEAALETMRPALTVKEDQYQDYEYRLTNLPAFATILSGLAALVFLFLSEVISGGTYQLVELADFRFSAALLRAFYVICWFHFGVFVYHTIHQLSLINRIYTDYSKVNLYHLKPLYGFSNLTALTAGSLILLPYGFLYINPTIIQINDPVVLSFYLTITLIAVVTFLLPQLGIHRIQDAEKSRLKAEAYKRYEAIVAEIHRRVDDNDFAGVSELSMGFTSLEQEINTIKKTATWPWQPETIRWLVTALVLPLGLWLIQYLLQQLLSK
jgi:hypothetical protein